MKKYWKIAALLLALTLLAACGSAAGINASGATAADNGYYEEAAEEEAFYDWEAEAPAATPQEAESASLSSSDGVARGVTTGSLSEKIIYTAYAEVETTEFDKSVQTVYQLMNQYGAFLESSSVTGSNLNDGYYGVTSNRSADFSLRVPREKYAAMTGALDSVGNVTYLTSDAENITARYTDVESRKKALQLQEDRLLEILAKAETVEDMITLESRLSEIRYEKENLTSQLNNWDNQVAYSTVNLHVQEVKVLTPEPEPEPETYWQKVGAGFVSTLKGLGRAAKDLFRVFVAALPVLVILAAIVVILVLAIRKYNKRQRQAREAAAQRKAAAEADYAREHAPEQRDD